MKRLILLIFFVLPLNAETESSYQRIRFTGLEYVSKHDIIRSAGVYSKDGRIIVNKEKLDAALKGNSAIADYKIIDNKGILTIVVEENQPEIAVYVVGSGSSRFCEIDNNYNIVTIGEIRSSSTPLIILPVESFEEKRLEEETVKRVENAINLAKSYPVWNQIDSMDFTESNFLRITLKGRESVFEIFEDSYGFERLVACLGYLDTVERYPSLVNLREKIFVFE
ncbi:MAG TPA: hypothetical protein P5123_09480 [Spirochaetota bacterium]|nr:hypothetical protein [Spirochaetota bacterium]